MLRRHDLQLHAACIVQLPCRGGSVRQHVASRVSSLSVCSIGATTMEQLKEDIDAFENLELDEETLAAIDAIHLQARGGNCCRRCRRCRCLGSCCFCCLAFAARNLTC